VDQVCVLFSKQAVSRLSMNEAAPSVDSVDQYMNADGVSDQLLKVIYMLLYLIFIYFLINGAVLRISVNGKSHVLPFSYFKF
jgi:hypothetical protein